MAVPVPNWDGFVREVDTAFVRSYRRPLAAFSLFAGQEFRTKGLGTRTVEWKKIGDMSGAVISMDIPPLSADAVDSTDYNIQVPVFTKDLHYDERDYEAAQRAGVDVVAAERAGRALAEELNAYLLKGRTGGPGATTSILNHADRLTVNNSATTNWETANDMVKDLNKGIAKLLDKGHPGPFVMMLNPLDSDLLGTFVTSTSVQAQAVLPRLVGGVLFEKEVAQNKAYLVAKDNTNYDFVSPLGLGAVQRRVKVDPIMGSVDIRWLAAGTPRVKLGDGVCEFTFDRS